MPPTDWLIFSIKARAFGSSALKRLGRPRRDKRRRKAVLKELKSFIILICSFVVNNETVASD